MNGPAVSVLLPVRDGAAHLESALRSLRRQTFADFEVCLEDDGSTDASFALAARAAARDPRVRPSRSAPLGLVAALNRAAARARGRLLVRMDADDLCHPARLERLWAAARETPAARLLGSAVRYAPRRALTPGMLRYERWLGTLQTHSDVWRARLTECPIVHASWALDPALVRELGGWREGPFPEDYDFLLRALAHGARTRVLPEPLLTVRLAGASASRRDPRYGPEAFARLKLAHLCAWLAAEPRPAWIVGAGPSGKAWARRLLAAGVTPAGFLDPRPGRAGQRILGLCVRDPAALPPRDEGVLLLCVGHAPSRAEAADRLEAGGREEGRDWLRLH